MVPMFAFIKAQDPLKQSNQFFKNKRYILNSLGYIQFYVMTGNRAYFYKGSHSTIWQNFVAKVKFNDGFLTSLTTLEFSLPLVNKALSIRLDK